MLTNSEAEYFDDEIQDVKVTKGHARSREAHREPKSGTFEPDKFEDHYETVLLDLIIQKTR